MKRTYYEPLDGKAKLSLLGIVVLVAVITFFVYLATRLNEYSVNDEYNQAEVKKMMTDMSIILD